MSESKPTGDAPQLPLPGVVGAAARRDLVMQRKLEDPLYYSDYLRIGDLLKLQEPKSKEAGQEAHDEHLFIVVHQVYELWFKQILHEIDSVRRIFMSNPVDERQVGTAVARLQRIREIQTVLLQQVTVLETMSPLDFLEFRDYLYPASGFQSLQFRLVENKLGLPASARLQYGHRSYCTYLQGTDVDTVQAAEKEPSLFQLVEAWLERTPFLEAMPEDGGSTPGSGGSGEAPVYSWWRHYKAAVGSMLDEDERAIRESGTGLVSDEAKEIQLKELASQRESFACLFDESKYEALLARGDRRMSYKATQAALLVTLYQDEPLLQLPARLLSLLGDIDEQFTAWRQRHALMVHRMLGIRMGTGGSSGYAYLRATAERHKIFSDIATLSTFLVPRYALPPLPAYVRERMAYAYNVKGGSGSSCGGSATPASPGGFVTPAAPAPAAAAAPVAPHPLPPGYTGSGKCPFAHK